MLPQLRQNIITGEWVVIAPERAKRPQDFIIPESVKVTKKENCPFCLGSKVCGENQKVRGSETKDIFIIQNKFPAFKEELAKDELRSSYPEDGFYRVRPAFGDHEVIVVKNHDLNLISLPEKIMSEMFKAMRDRYLAMKEQEGIASIMPIYNHGPEAGASIEHPHAQIFASGVVTNTVSRELEGAERYFGINGICVFCDIIKHEERAKIRIVFENRDFIAVTFFAARFPMETWILPKKHESQFETLNQKLLDSFAEVVSFVVKRLDKNIPRIPLNFYIHTLPVALEGSAYYHWHLEIIPRITNYGGFEMGSGVVIDIMNPEDAAKYLRK